MIDHQTIEPCLFFSHVSLSEAIVIPIELHRRVDGQNPVNPVLERYLLGEEATSVFFDVLAYALRSGVSAAGEIQFSLGEETVSFLEERGFLIDGNSFGFPLLVGVYLYSLGRCWPSHCLTSGQLFFVREQIVSVGAASQKLQYAMRQLPPGGYLFLPQCNVRRLRRSGKWQFAPLSVLPKRIADGVALLLDKSTEV